MKKFIAFITSLLMLLPFTTVRAQSKTVDANSLLWRVSKGSSTPSFLFGTIHIICKDDYLWTKAMDESLAKSSKVCMEMDLDDPTLPMQLAMKMMSTDGKKLQDYFSAEDYKIVEKYVSDHLSPDMIGMLQQLSPVMLDMLLSSSQAGDCKNSVSYEVEIMNLSQKKGKEIMGLETIDDQLEALNAVPMDSIIKDLLNTAKGISSGDDGEFRQMIDAYKHQDIRKLNALIKASNQLGLGIGALLDDRNKKWIPGMSKMMKDGSVFFAVGAGHLYGDNGVIQLLRKEGYRVEPLK